MSTHDVLTSIPQTMNTGFRINDKIQYIKIKDIILPIQGDILITTDFGELHIQIDNMIDKCELNHNF